MTDYQKLYNGISKAAWGYFFIYFDFNINGVSVIPSFIGYILFLSAIDLLKDDERDLSLLRPLGFILVLWHIAKWCFSWIGMDIEGVIHIADIIISLVNLYFHFQLLTDLASIAKRYQSDGYKQDVKLLKYRTMQTVMLTAITVISELSLWLTEVWTYISLIMLVVYVIAGICLMKALFDLRKCFTISDETSL